MPVLRTRFNYQCAQEARGFRTHSG
jgi:hypothetical protein